MNILRSEIYTIDLFNKYFNGSKDQKIDQLNHTKIFLLFKLVHHSNKFRTYKSSRTQENGCEEKYKHSANLQISSSQKYARYHTLPEPYGLYGLLMYGWAIQPSLLPLPTRLDAHTCSAVHYMAYCTTRL